MEDFCGLWERARDEEVNFVSSARDDAVVSSLLGRREEDAIVCRRKRVVAENKHLKVVHCKQAIS